MLKAQKFFDRHIGKYQANLILRDENLEGELNLTQFVNLEQIDLSNNLITKLISLSDSVFFVGSGRY